MNPRKKFYYVNLSRDVIGVTKIANQFPPVSTGMVDLMILAATAIWIYGTDVLRRFPECARALYWIFLAITPFLAFFLEELCWKIFYIWLKSILGNPEITLYGYFLPSDIDWNGGRRINVYSFSTIDHWWDYRTCNFTFIKSQRGVFYGI